MASQTLKAALRPPGDRLTLTYEDAAGRPLEIRTIAANPTIRIDKGAPIPLSGPRIRADGVVVEYELPERIGPGTALTLDAPAGWVLTTNGAVPAQDALRVANLTENLPLDALKVENPSEVPGRLEVQKSGALQFESARVLASGRTLELIFTSDTEPEDLGTFVDHHVSKAGRVALSSGRNRTSLQFATCSVSGGQNDAYAWVMGGLYSRGTQGETLTVYSGGTPIGTIPPIANTNEVQQVAVANANGGTFALSFFRSNQTRTTAPIPFKASAATVQATINALPHVGTNATTVTGPDGGPWTVTFSGGSVSSANQPLLTCDASGLTGDRPTVAVTVVTEGISATTAVQDAFLAIFKSLGATATSKTDRWQFENANYVLTNESYTYTLKISGGGRDFLTEPIPYLKPNTGSQNNVTAATNAIRKALGADCVTGYMGNNEPRNFGLIFSRDDSPVWPLTLSVVESSVPDLVSGLNRDSIVMMRQGTTPQFTVYFSNALGVRDLDLSVRSSNPSSPLNSALQRLLQGDNRYRWKACWYIHDPDEVVQYGETLTVSGPVGLLAGSRIDRASQAAVATGDSTAAFADQPVDNQSWAGPDGVLSNDLCHVTDLANGVDDSWERWRSEPPPAAWIFSNPLSTQPADQRPMRIAYVDPVNGTNAASASSNKGIARLNDPTRPYNSPAAAVNDLRASQITNRFDIVIETPRLILFKKGTTTVSDATVVANSCGTSHDAPLIWSTYWMAADGPEPSPYATLHGTITGHASEPIDSHHILFYGLVWEGGYVQNSPVRDLAFWDCVFPPHKDSSRVGSIVGTNDVTIRMSFIRCLFYDHWNNSGGNIAAIHGTGFHDLLIDQTAFIRCGYRGFADGYGPGDTNGNGKDESYLTWLGGDVTADINEAPYYNNFTHNIYIGDGTTTPVLLFNSYSMQGVFASLDCRPGVMLYGCCHYRENFGAQTIGDRCHARASSSHVRRNLHLRLRTQNRAQGIQCSTIGGLQACASMVQVFEDNLFLEPDQSGSDYTMAWGTYDLGSLSAVRAIVYRHNTTIDQTGYLIRSGQGDPVPPATLRLLVSHNLIVRSPDEARPSSLLRIAKFSQMAPWPGLVIDQNLYMVSAPSTRDFRPSALPKTVDTDFAGWQGYGFDARGAYRVGTIATATPRPAGGPDVLIDYLAEKAPGTVTDMRSALTLLRSRRPGTWDDDLYTPLGRSGGILAKASALYLPTDAIEAPAGSAGAYYGALDYTVPATDPVSSVGFRPALKMAPPRRQRVSQ